MNDPPLRRNEIVVMLWTEREPFEGLEPGEPYLIGTLYEKNSKFNAWKVWDAIRADFYGHWVSEARLRKATLRDLEKVERLMALWKTIYSDGENVEGSAWYVPPWAKERFEMLRIVIKDGGMFPEKAMP